MDEGLVENRLERVESSLPSPPAPSTVVTLDKLFLDEADEREEAVVLLLLEAWLLIDENLLVVEDVGDPEDDVAAVRRLGRIRGSIKLGASDCEMSSDGESHDEVEETSDVLGEVKDLLCTFPLPFGDDRGEVLSRA
jgi:hypothetical protein